MSNIDNQIKQKGESFSLEPRPQVWKRVEQELNTNNRGRIIGWWWLTPVVIIAWGFAFYFLDRKDNKAFYNEDTTHHPLSENKKLPAGKQQVVVIKELSKPAINQSTPTASTPSLTNNTAHKSVSSSTQKSTTAVYHRKAINRRDASTTIAINDNKAASPAGTAAGSSAEKQFSSGSSKTAPPAETNKLREISTNNIESQTIPTLSQPGEKSTRSDAQAENIKPVQLPAKDQPAVSHSNVERNVAIGSAVVSPKQSVHYNRWRINFSAGMAINQTSLLNKPAKDTIDPSGGATGGGGMIPPLEKNKPGHTLAFSVDHLLNIGRRFQLQTGVMLQYQQMTQRTGAYQPFAITPNPPDWNYSSDYYFETGNEQTRKGNNYRVALSNDIAFSVFKKPSLFIKAGVYGGYNFDNHYLIADEVQLWWLPATTSRGPNAWFGGINAGIEYRLPKGITFGVTARHDLTEAFKPLAKDKYYWRNATFNLSLPVILK